MATEKSWTRQELKRNELAEAVANVVHWIARHRETSLAGTLTLVVGLAILAYLVFHARAVDDQAWYQLALAQGLAGQQTQRDQAVKVLNEFDTRFRTTSAYPHSLLTKADLLSSQKQYPEAIQLYETLLGLREAKSLYPMTYSALGVVQEDTNRLTEAQTTYRTFLDKFPDHFLAPRVYESLARVEEVLGNVQEARALYDKLAVRYPNTPWAERAQERLTTLPQVTMSTTTVQNPVTNPHQK
ncbi:MAG: tetratricopeptide repeat protein [Elusimicrobia bacterium]|nr:tetratricopeptide repeat protein [Elusimicrobiota bacterium]